MIGSLPNRATVRQMAARRHPPTRPRLWATLGAMTPPSGWGGVKLAGAAAAPRGGYLHHSQFFFATLTRHWPGSRPVCRHGDNHATTWTRHTNTTTLAQVLPTTTHIMYHQTPTNYSRWPSLQTPVHHHYTTGSVPWGVAVRHGATPSGQSRRRAKAATDAHRGGAATARALLSTCRTILPGACRCRKPYLLSVRPRGSPTPSHPLYTHCWPPASPRTHSCRRPNTADLQAWPQQHMHVGAPSTLMCPQTLKLTGLAKHTGSRNRARIGLDSSTAFVHCTGCV